MQLFLYLILLFFLGSCTTVEVTKEIFRAGDSVKTSITEIIQDDKKDKEEKKSDSVKNETKKIEEEKETISEEQSKEQNIIKNQQKIVKMNFLGNSFKKVKEILGNPNLTRQDGNTLLLRFNSDGCRLFLFFDNNDLDKKVKYFELRNPSGDLINSKQSIEQCYREFNLME